jgi:hypothetical protein
MVYEFKNIYFYFSDANREQIELNPINTPAPEESDIVQTPTVINFSKPECVRWTNFRKSAVLEGVQNMPAEDQEHLVEDFREKWNQGIC